MVSFDPTKAYNDLPPLPPRAELESRAVLKACIEAVLHGTEMSFEDALRLEGSLFAMTCGTEDIKEGMTAFLEKRDAAFKGR